MNYRIIIKTSNNVNYYIVQKKSFIFWENEYSSVDIYNAEIYYLLSII